MAASTCRMLRNRSRTLFICPPGPRSDPGASCFCLRDRWMDLRRGCSALTLPAMLPLPFIAVAWNGTGHLSRSTANGARSCSRCHVRALRVSRHKLTVMSLLRAWHWMLPRARRALPRELFHGTASLRAPCAFPIGVELTNQSLHTNSHERHQAVHRKRKSH
jgi:hypothetical protein